MSVENCRKCFLLVDEYRVFVPDNAGTLGLDRTLTHRIDEDVVEVVSHPSTMQFPPVSEVLADLAEKLDRGAWGEDNQ